MTSPYPAKYWSYNKKNIQCSLCPRACIIKNDKTGFCKVRQNAGNRLYLTSYGCVNGLCFDPIEKKPLYHFFPGSEILSIGSAGYNFDCRFCQNYSLSRCEHPERLPARVTPQSVAQFAVQHNCPYVAFTYNEPIISAEFVIETALACKESNIKTVAVSNGYIHAKHCEEFFSVMDAANIDLKAFKDDFYRHYCSGKLQPVLDTLLLISSNTGCWLEITNLLIPGLNDAHKELEAMCLWIAEQLGRHTPLHFSAFFPTHQLTDIGPTPPSTVHSARSLAMQCGLNYVYTGNLRSPEGSDTICPQCDKTVILRKGYSTRVLLKGNCCPHCDTPIQGAF